MRFLPLAATAVLSVPALTTAFSFRPIHSKIKVPSFVHSSTSCPSSAVLAQFYYPASSEGEEEEGNLDWSVYSSTTASEAGLAYPTASPSTFPLLASRSPQSFLRSSHAKGRKALLGISGPFGKLCATQLDRESLVKSIRDVVETDGWDGVDLDWELLDRTTEDGFRNKALSIDLLSFVQLLRTVLGDTKLITASVPNSGGSAPAGGKFAKAFAATLDFITVMSFDFHASAWSTTTGPMAPLAKCSPASSSVPIAVQSWIAAGFPACKILLGVAGYSHLFRAGRRLKENWYNGLKTKAFQPLTDDQPEDPTYTYNQLISSGWLSRDGRLGQSGYRRYWDPCTSTPFLFSSSTRLFVAYEDLQSIGTKASWAHAAGLAGVNFYDSSSSHPALLAAARAGIEGRLEGTAADFTVQHPAQEFYVSDLGIFEGSLIDIDVHPGTVDAGEIVRPALVVTA